MNRKKLLKRKTPLKRTPIRRVSKKLSKELKLYYVLRDEFLMAYPRCRVGPSREDIQECTGAATQVHHSRGRGPFLNDTATFIPTCPSCHEYIHANGKWAREMGWTLT